MDDIEDEFDWGEAYKRLFAYAVSKLGRSRSTDAEEIAQEAIRQFFDPEHYDWERSDGDGLDELLRDLGSRVNGLVSNYWKKRKRRGDWAHLDTDPPAATASPEVRVANAEDLQWAVNEVLDRIAENDELAGEVLLQMSEGVEHPGDIASVLGVGVKKVYNARRRLKPHIDAVARELEGRQT